MYRVILLTIPTICVVFMLFTKTKRDKRADAIKNATVMTTAVRVGENGRTVFETKATQQAPRHKQSLSRKPILPYTTQQVTPMARPKSITQKTWQRLSRPFSTTAPAAYQKEDQIELRQKPTPYRSRFHEYTSPVSPITGPSYSGSTSSWNTIDRLDGPISPLSVTNTAPPSSIAGTINRGVDYSNPQFQTGRGYSFSHISLTPPAISPGISVADKVKSRPVVGAGEEFGGSMIKENVLDRTNMKINKIYLQKAPGAKKGK
ncbi:hypothetical protein H2198_009438 [Neophaeococcomyces mojaviensis]|uniref:Uncharacterized protein n=1 Tax=Neophaeococcomyces mojaviensis TaxID=3383035 RepID=A0ACC2ZUP9_9EURO|nr:hypothetical protein H2198_009438 [Knufia sp. JES_112]